MNTYDSQPPQSTPSGEFAFVTGFRYLAGKAHSNSEDKGFWKILETVRALPNKADAAELESLYLQSRLALMHSELSEALTGIRKGLMDDHLPHRSMEVAELADTIIRIMDYAAGFDLPVAEVVLEKMAYNRGRPYKHGDVT